MAALITVPLIYSISPAESQKPAKQNFGEQRTTNIFPTQVITNDWANGDDALTQDLNDHALYQDFTENNSSYLGVPENEEQNDNNESGNEIIEESVDTPVADDNESLETESQPSTLDEVTEPEPEPDPEPEQQTEPETEEAEPTSDSSDPVTYRTNVFDVHTVAREYPLAQLTLTSTTEALPEDVESVPVDETASSTDDGTSEEEVEGLISPIEPQNAGEIHQITLENFNTAALEPGQFIDGMQLKLSFGARLKSYTENQNPYVEVLFGTDEGVRSVGVILIDQEISNAMNGGYHLFALPSFMPVEELAQAKVILRYYGDKETVDGMFLDAAWLEMDTRIITKEDLIERGLAEQLTHLDAPETSVLVSDQLNFDLSEHPVFNLRYESQQNLIVRGFMKLIGQSSFAVKSVLVIHETLGEIDVKTKLNVTKDGLITIEIPEEEKEKLPPGTYKVALQFDENGYEYTDAFGFQWGVLAINPLRSEYEVGDTALVAMAALSPNGNTLCEANLDLYITDPIGAVTKVEVEQSGECNGNNVIDVPDYMSEVPTLMAGEYGLYLEKLDEEGNLIGFTNDTFKVVNDQRFSIEREGPTRIYPGAPYKMNLTVTTKDSFRGTLRERIPASFIVSSTSAEIEQDGDWQILTWDVSTGAGGDDEVTYTLDAPDISPYLYLVGAAQLESTQGQRNSVSDEPDINAASSSEEVIEPLSSSTEPIETELVTEVSSSTEEVEEESSESEEGSIVFEEHRQWQIASDATGSMLLLWAGATVPTGWTCVSCSGGDAFYQRFIVGSSTAGVNGGAATHTHTVSAAVAATASFASTNAGGANNYAATTHTHTFTPTVGAASNLPAYRQLVIIQNNSAGEPTSIPTGAITLFDAAVPTGWTQYNAQNGNYVRGESLANRTLTGGANTHTHSITGTLAASAGTANANTAGAISVANSAHTHTVNTVTTADANQPPYIEVILGQLNATSTMPDNAIAMWTDSNPGGWTNVSTTSQAFNNRFFKPAATYGTTGGASTHTPANQAVNSQGPSATTNRGGAGNNRASGAHTHALNLSSFSAGNHLPPYRSVIFGKRAGGSPPNAPTIHSLFDDEKTGTSTPSFEFTADDPYGTDTLVYQFQWDDDVNLDDTPLGDRTSDVETGCSPNCFQNTITTGDTNPYNENERMRFTIRTALTNNTTYYWRVRAKKTIGGTYGSWSSVQAFTHVVDTDPSQWYQTQDDQFSGNTFSSTEVSGANSVQIVQATTTEALIVYGEGVVQTPRYRIWDGSNWGAESSAQSVGGTIQWMRTEAGTKRDEYILATQDDVNDVNVQIFNGTSNTWGNLVEATTGVSDNSRRGFDVSYESVSGDAIVVYCDGDTNPSYRIWNGSSWSSAASITTSFSNACNYIALANDPVSDELIVVMRDTGTIYESQVWTGSAWGNATSLGSIVDTNNEGIAVEYEESGGQAMVVASNGANGNFIWTSWNGTEWSTALTHALGDDFQWGILKADVGSDNLALCYVDTDADIGLVRWNGEAWQTSQEYEATGNADTGRPVSCEFETTSGRDGYIMMPYSDDTNARYRFWNGASVSAEASISTITDSWEVGSVRTGEGKILSFFHDDINTQYDFSYWNGTTWSALLTLEGSPSVTADPRRQPIAMTAKIYEPAVGSMTSSRISFGLVPNRPTWGEVNWSVTEPAGSSVTIQVLYATTTVCNVLVPDVALPGNSTGFDESDMPLNISGLSTSTYGTLCLKASLATDSVSPTLDDWTLSWERQPYLSQANYRWYANRNLETPNDAWPSGGIDLVENEAIPQAYSPGSGDLVRLRMSVRSDNSPLVADADAFKLQYSESLSCASSSVWYDVGAIGSTTAAWRGHNNLLAFDGSTISSLLLTNSDVGGSYEEENNSDTNPNAITAGNEAEWDWVLEHNVANDGVQYCFRMVTDSGAVLNDYEQYPTLVTNASPAAPSLEKLFDNEQVASTSPWFEFVAEDVESDDVSYQIQVDDTYDFSSAVLDRNSTTNLSEFENTVTPADKDAFTSGQTIRFKPSSALTNNTTYYWRVRSKDGNGSNAWGSWSTVYSFRVNTGTTVTTWFQTEQEQFDTDSFTDTESTASDDVILTTGFTTGTTTGSAIDFDNGTYGNAWGSLSWNHNVTAGSIRYRIEYLNNGVWTLVPDSYLPGNAVGYTTSPVSLLGLDPEVHNQIRIRSNFTDTGGTPRLLDWKIEWGYAVEQPTMITLFDNEKVGTTTPAFTFTTVDPESNDLQYEISWSQDNTFVSGTTTMRSGVASGYTNDTNGADTSPFASGNTIRYKIQAANALTNGNTYWWRVRARDPLGGNVWSVWSEVKSFTVDTTVGVSTWYQTTDEQFATDTLNDVQTTGSDSVVITSIIREAFLSYAEGTVQTPRYRIWNGSAWTEEASADSVGGSIRFVETAASPSRDEYAVVTQDSTGRVRAQIYDGASDTFGDLDTIITAVPSAVMRGYDVAYESNSGDAIVVACNGTEAQYKVWNGSSWSSATAITLGVSTNCNWVKLVADPVSSSDEMILVVRDATTGATDYQALVWNGSSWGNSMTLGGMAEVNEEGIAVEYEESGDRAVVVVSNALNAQFAWNSWNGSAWGTASTFTIQDDFENGVLVRDLGSDNMALCSIDNDGQIALTRWNGTTNAWTSPYTTVDTLGNSKVGRPFGCEFETTSGRDGYIMIPYSDTTNARYQSWNGSALSGETSVSTIQDSVEIRSTRTGDGNILSMFYDDANTQYDFSYWNGTAWSTINTLEATSITTTVPATIPLDIVSRRYPTFTTGSVYSAPIVFSEGSGLKWQQATFNDSTPGSSDILYQIEYLSGDTWALIPNSALSGNSSGFTTSPIDLSQISRTTYSTIRLRANLSCSGGNCPTLNDWTVNWSEGINVSGSVKQYDQTASTTSGTVAVAVNGALQTGKTGTISNGSWTIANVQAFAGDVVTVFVQSASDAAEAVGIARYDGDGDITGINMFERHLVLGSNDATTTAMTNTDIGLYDFANTEDIFFNVSGTTLSMCATSGCSDSKLYVRSNVRFTPGGRFVTHDFQNYGYFTAGSYTHEINGSWDNNATSTMTGSTVVFAATSSSESVDSTGASVEAFNNVTFGTTTGSATWSLPSTLDVDGTLTVSRGTLARGSAAITLAGSLVNGTNGSWTGLGTTTFDGSSAATWNDQNATKQNIGKVVVDGTSKAVTLASNVAAESIFIGANDTLDASVTGYDITVYGGWINQNNFVARTGEVFFSATTSGKSITTAGDAFYDLTFAGSGGGWSFTETTLNVGNDFKSNAGTVTLPTATTTVTGSFTVTSGTFQHNNGTLLFNSAAAETLTFAGGAFTNAARNLWFAGTGSWTFSDTNATSTNYVRVQQGTVNFPSGVLAIGGALRDTGGVYNPGTGTVSFYSATSQILTAGGSSFNTVVFNGAGSWSFTDTNVTVLDDVRVQQGTVTLPSGTLSIAGSYDNNATVTPGTGTVLFNSTDTGETIDFGSSALYNVWLNHSGGGWTVTAPATTTNNFSITAVNSFTVNSGQTLAVGGTFTNSVGGTATNWTGATLSLTAGNYSLNTKTNTGDLYGTLRVASNTDISMWNSSSTAYAVNSTGSLYSRDHGGVDGDLYIWGSYERSGGSEYWSNVNDFDGTALTGGNVRQVDVRFASGASASFSNAALTIHGSSSASTTIANQGSGTYTVSLNGGSLDAEYYQFADLGGAGLSLLNAASVSSMDNGAFTVGAGGASAITLSSTTIDASPSKQITNIRFATTTAIAAYNVSQTDGTPSSFWWFRTGTGNLYGEAFDNDTGNPGSVRFDDSSILLTISGTVYSDAGVTPITGGTCDGSAQVVKVVVEGGASYTGSCSNVDGSYSIANVAIIGDKTLTIYLDGASGGQRGSIITRTPTTNITDANIYANRVIVRNEDVEALTNANLAVYDASDDSDLRFAVTGNNLVVMAGNELFVSATSTFTPGGTVSLYANAGANGYDGTLYIANGATFNAYSTSTLTVGGRFVLESGADFNPASTTVLMNATTSGKSITAPLEIDFNHLTFNGSGGGWNIGADIEVMGNMTITAGTVTGTGDIAVPYGSLTGNGTLSLGAGTTTMSRSNSLGGTSPWTFYNLQLGNGIVAGTTTPAFTATTTVAGRLTISTAHFLDANATTWDLSGTGTVFVESGTFLEDTSTIRYSGAGSNVRSTTYYNLDLNAGAGSQTYTATGLGIIVSNHLTVGGTSNSTFNVTASDIPLDINGALTIRTNGTFQASDTAIFTVAGNYNNDGVFTGNNGTLTFDGAAAKTIAAGNSSFSNVVINTTGTVAVTEHATTTTNWRLTASAGFTVNSGQVLAVGGRFTNAIAGGNTTWTGSTLRLSGNANYSINNATTSDQYATLDVEGTTQIRMWNSDASSYAIDSTASLYSQDHGNNDGDLYIWGAYRKTTGSDFWSYAYDFDGTALGGSSRKVDVFMASGASVLVSGGSLGVYGASSASTTIQNQGSGTYGLTISGTASSSFQYYEIKDTNSSGLVLSGAPTIRTLSYGNIEVSQNGGSGITVGGTVITANPARNFTQNRFALDGVGSGVNVTATGTTLSAWRFANHQGDIDGEAFDTDPGGDPGYIAWDDSAALITVSGTVYSDEGSTVSGVCDGVTNNVTLRVAGLTTYTTTCNGTTGAYSISNVAYGVGDSLVVFIDGETEKGASVTKEPVSNITSFHIYENRIILRHENTDPITIDDMAVWDSSDDADIPFTAVSGSPDSLTLPANRKLIVASGKSFEPGGNVTLSGGGAGAAYDGTLELYSNADWIGQGTEALSVGGSMILNASAEFTSSNGTTTFTTSGANRTIDVNAEPFHTVVFNGSGSWTITDPTLTVNNNFRITSGTVDLPTGTSTFNGSFVKTGGSFDANGGLAIFTGAGPHTLAMGGSDLAEVIFTGGNYTMSDTNATTTESITIESGTITLPSGVLSIGGNFENIGGAITHNTSLLALRNVTSATLLASSSDLFGVTFTGGGAYTMADDGITLLDDFSITSGSVALASGTMAVGGSWTTTGGTFTNATTTILFNSSDTGETINPGSSSFYAVQVGAPTGGYTIQGNATTTHNFTLASAQSFAVQSGVTVKVLGVFTNSVGGTNTAWNGTLALFGSTAYSLNTKLNTGDRYNTLYVGPNTDIRMWNSSATTTTVSASGSLYSQDHNATNGALNIYGDFHIGTSTEYWSYATDFDGAALGGSPRSVTVLHAQNATTTVDGGTLNIVGISGTETTISNQGSGTYAMRVTAGTFNAQYYEMRNLNVDGLYFSGTPVVSSLSYGDFELAVNGGSLITVSSSTVNANASMVHTGNRFATTSAITGNNVTLNGSTISAWTFISHAGNLDGEAFDDDGVDQCGSIRWADSSCLITQQTQYRWRNDDGGIGVPNSEWFNSSWDARKSVRIDNADSATYTDPVVKINVAFDSDMQADFDDLRFTEDDGTTLIPHWIGSSTDSVAAEVWLKLPTLPADGTATAYMYYYNPTATTTSSAENTFLAADDFEDGDLSEYSGQTTLFTVDGTFANDGAYGLDNTGDEETRSNAGGIYRLDQTVSQGETIRYKQYVDINDGDGDETCTKFGVQNPGTANDNYAVCIEQFGTDRITLVRDAVENDNFGSVVMLASSTVTFESGWYEVEIDWEADDDIIVSLYDESRTLVTTISDNDGTYTSGGIGFAHWFHYGGWDSFSSRPTLATEPTVRFGAEVGDGGASWKAAQNTVAVYSVGDIARLRLVVENSGLTVNDQEFLLEFAPMGAAPSCEAVDPAEFEPVPTQASCGTSAVCMQASSLVVNAVTTADLLLDTIETFATGEYREDPTNITGQIDLAANRYAELEYAITPTSNTVDEDLCFRVTDNGDDYDTYLSVAHMSLRFDPIISTPFLNGGADISLLPGTTTRIYATTTVTDLNGAADLAYATSTFYRSGVGPSCTPDNNNCYVTQCPITDRSGNTATLNCYADIFFHADPTDNGTYLGESWIAYLEVEDQEGGYDLDTTPDQQLLELRAIDVENAISYGSLAVGQNTGTTNASTTVDNQGNVEINIEVEGTDMTDGVNSYIPANEQKFATSTFNYSTCGITVCASLSSTTAYELDVDLSKPTTNSPPVADAIYWGVEVPPFTNSAPHSGINVFTPVSP